MTTLAWLGWVAAALGVVAAVYWRSEYLHERGRRRSVASLKPKPRSPVVPPPLPPPPPYQPLVVPRGAIMRRLTGVFRLPRFRLPGDEDDER